MGAGEGQHVHGPFAQVRVELPGEPEAGNDAGHREGHQVVGVVVGGIGQLVHVEADVVQSSAVNAECLVGVLDQMVGRQGGIVIKSLWRW